MSLLLAAAAATGSALITRWWDRRTTAAADHWHFDRVRADVTPVRQIVEDADRKDRLYRRAERQIVRLKALNADLLDRCTRLHERARLVGPTPNPNPFPHIRLFRWLP